MIVLYRDLSSNSGAGAAVLWQTQRRLGIYFLLPRGCRRILTSLLA